MMADIILPEQLIRQIEAIAEREKRSVTEILASMLEQYKSPTTEENEEPDPIDKVIGIYDDDITDMSTTVRETMKKIFQDKDDRSD